MPCPQLILLGSFARTHQISKRLGAFVRNPHCRQITGSVTARQFLGIAAIGLHAVASFYRDQCRRYHLALDSQLRQLPVDYITSRAGLITSPQLLYWTKLLYQLTYRFGAVENRSKASYLIWRAPITQFLA
jgi:hypothetical protein